MRGTVEVEASLESFALLRRHEWGSRAAGADDSHERHWDFTGSSFSSEWQTANADCPPRKRGPAYGIPRLELPQEFEAGAWRSTELGTCATSIDHQHGATLPGKATADAELRALISASNLLFVDVTEATQAKPGARLTVCSSEWTAQSYDYCQNPQHVACVAIGMDGRVLSGSASVERAPDRPRFRVQLPAETNALALIYSDARGRSVATSAYRAGDATSLGNVFRFNAKFATCALSAGGLSFVLAPRRPDEPLMDSEGIE